MERDCTYNNGVICNRPDCCARCSWNPRELRRRKQIIGDGEGLQVGTDGLKRLIIKKEENITDAD